MKNKKVYHGSFYHGACVGILGYVLAETNQRARAKFIKMNEEFVDNKKEAERVNVRRCKTLEGIITKDIDCNNIRDDEFDLLKDKGLAVWRNGWNGKLAGYSFNELPEN